MRCRPVGQDGSMVRSLDFESHGLEGKHLCKNVVMAVDMEHSGLMLLRAGRNQEIGYRKTVATLLPKLSMGRHGCLDCLRIHAQIAKDGEVILDVRIVALTLGAVEHLKPHDGTYADLSELECRWSGSLQCRLVDKQQSL